MSSGASRGQSFAQHTQWHRVNGHAPTPQGQYVTWGSVLSCWRVKNEKPPSGFARDQRLQQTNTSSPFVPPSCLQAERNFPQLIP